MMKQNRSRRQFLKGMFGGLGAAVVTRVGWLFPEGQQVLARQTRQAAIQATKTLEQLEVGELYAGFLLLPDDIPVPDFVEYPPLGPPIVCGEGNGPGGNTSMVIKESFNSAERLAGNMDFPIYTLDELPNGLYVDGANSIRYETGEVFTASVNFETLDSNYVGSVVSVIAQPSFPKPFPLKWSNPIEQGAPATVLEKVDFLPSPGIMVATRTGYVFHWIKEDTLYKLVVEYELSREEAQLLAGSLVQVG